MGIDPGGVANVEAVAVRTEGVDIEVISKQLGHSSISTIAKYLDHIDPRAVVEAMANRSW